MVAIEVRASGPGFAIAVWGSVVVVTFATTPTEEAAREMAKITADLARTTGGKIGMLHVVNARGGAPPGSAARAQYLRMIRDQHDSFAATAIVASGSGFVPSMVRSVAAGFIIAARPKFPIRTFSHATEASDFLARHIAIDRDDLIAAMDQTTAAMHPTPREPS